MERTTRFLLLASLTLALLVGDSGVTGASFTDVENSTDNVLRTWISSMWVQTFQADFVAGVLKNVDIITSPDDVILASVSKWYDINWDYRRAITIDHTRVQDVVDPSTVYADFPVLVYATGLANIGTGGADIRFTSSDGVTELPREIESYSDGTLYAWVKVTLTNDSGDSSDDVIYMYYGNTFATEPPADSTYGAQNVWTSNYGMVLHLNETSGTHFDSTSSNNNANVNGTPIQDAAGQIAGGIEFRGVANEWIANNSALDTSNTFTIELWGNYQVTSNYQTAIWYQTSGSEWRELITIDSSGNIKSWWNGGSSGVDLLTDWDHDEWHYYVFAYDGNIVYAYKDGQYSSQVTTDYNSATGIAHWKIGDRDDANQPLDGTVDEYRFSTTNRSATWIQTSYNNQSTPSDFCGVGNEEARGALTGTLASQVLDSGIGGSWYDSNWSYRRAITIDHTRVQDVVDPSTVYADFPVLVYATGLANIGTGGADIRFTSSDGITELPREIESYSGGALYAWIKVTLTKDSSDSSDDVIYMYYGNTFATEPPADSTYGAQNVWTSSYGMVLHLNETSGTHFDSTSSNNNANVNGTPIQDAAGQIAGGIEFRGVANEWIANNSALDTSNTFTIELWGNYQVTSNYQTAIWYQTSGSGWRELITIDSSGNIKSWWNGGTYGVDLLTDWDYDEWHHYVFAYDGNTVYVYKDGQYSSQVTTDFNSATGINHWKIGDREDTNQPLDGTVDEYRFSTTNRNADWIQTSYNNQSTPSDFCSIGTEDSMATAIWVALSWDETLAVNTAITFEVRASDTPFVKDAVSPSWTVIGGTSPVTSGLPSGRYMQWQATLTTSDPSSTPTLHEVIVFYD